METVFENGEMEDPDYESLSQQQKREHGNLNTRQKDAKDQTIQKIDNIIRQQFGLEINLKEREIDVIHDRISHVKAMLDRLRACVLAKYYGTSDLKGNRTAARPDISNFGPRKSTRNRNTSVTFSQTSTESVAKIKSLPSQSSNTEARTSLTTEPLVNGNLVCYDFKETKPREAGTGILTGQTTCDNSHLSGKDGNLKLLSFDDLNVTRNLKEQLQVASSPDTLEPSNQVKQILYYQTAMASSICFHCILYSNFLFFHFFLMELHIKEIWSSSLHFSLPSGKYKILAFSKATYWKTRVCCRFRNKVFL